MAEPGSARPKKFWGQHFLRDRNLARKIVNSLQVLPPRVVVEIGPGEGILTEFLLEPGTRYIGIEIDPELAAHLTRRFGQKKNFHLLRQDVLDISFTDIIAPYRELNRGLIGNLPYNITSPLLFKLFTEKPPFQQAVFMVQKEVAQRMVSAPGKKSYGLLSVYCQLFARVEMLFTVPPQVFSPPPRVESAVVRLTFPSPYARRLRNRALFDRLVHQAFQQRRKMLRNSLSSLFPPEALRKLPIDLQLRPEQISVEQWLELSEYLQQWMNRNLNNGAHSVSD